MNQSRRIQDDFSRIRKKKNRLLGKMDYYPHFTSNSRLEVYNIFFNFSNLNNYPLYFPHPVKSNKPCERCRLKLSVYLAIKICICYNAVRQKVMMSPFGRKNESPDRNGVRSRDSSFLFIVAKHPLDYLLPLSCLSSHLLMGWQTTPAARKGIPCPPPNLEFIVKK